MNRLRLFSALAALSSAFSASAFASDPSITLDLYSYQFQSVVDSQSYFPPVGTVTYTAGSPISPSTGCTLGFASACSTVDSLTASLYGIGDNPGSFSSPFTYTYDPNNDSAELDTIMSYDPNSGDFVPNTILLLEVGDTSVPNLGLSFDENGDQTYSFYDASGDQIDYGSGVPETLSATPEPSSLALLGTGLVGLGGLVRRRLLRA